MTFLPRVICQEMLTREHSVETSAQGCVSVPSPGMLAMAVMQLIARCMEMVPSPHSTMQRHRWLTSDAFSNILIIYTHE